MISIFRGAVTLALLILFVRLAFWAWSSRRKELFDLMARMPLDEDDDNVHDNPSCRSKQS